MMVNGAEFLGGLIRDEGYRKQPQPAYVALWKIEDIPG